MELLCTNCGYDIDPKTANVQTNLVQCPKCYKIHHLDTLITAQKTIGLPSNFEDKFIENEQGGISIFENRNSDLITVTDDLIDANVDFKAPPANSHIESFGTSTMLEIIIPPKKFQAGDIGLIIFVTFWLGFLVVWTSMVIMLGAVFMALFSIPFWLVGIGMVLGITTSLTQKQSIELDRYSLRIIKKGWFLSTLHDIDVDDIVGIHREKSTLKNSFKNLQVTSNNSNNKNQTELPTLQLKSESITFLEHGSQEEMNWAIHILKQGILKFSEKKL